MSDWASRIRSKLRTLRWNWRTTRLAKAMDTKDADAEFRSQQYLRHNDCRLRHLESLKLPLQNSHVLELGAGVADHTAFFLDRGCTVLSVEPRPENCAVFRNTMKSWTKDRQASVHLMEATLEEAAKRINERFDIVYAYGILYHLSDPGAALQFMSNACSGLLLLETCVSLGEELSVNPTKEDGAAPSQAIGGMGCRPTRPWLWR